MIADCETCERRQVPCFSCEESQRTICYRCHGDVDDPYCEAGIADDSTKRARIAYEAFRGGLLPMDADVPRWEDAPNWIRDVAVVAYLQGKLDAPKRKNES